MLQIKSTSNSKYKYIKSLLTKKARDKNGEYTVEGIKSVSDAINSRRIISTIAVSEYYYNNINFEYPNSVDLLVVDDLIFPELCDTVTPQGIIAVIKTENSSDFEFDKHGKYVYCDNIQDPGNLGTIIRTAEAAGFSAVMLSPNCVDIHNPKVVRASMGSYFNIKIINNIKSEDILAMKNKGLKVYGGSLRDNTSDYRLVDYSAPVMVVVGNEANGISDEVLDMCNSVKIPIIGNAESLNASVAAGILIYEVLRNRS